MSHSREAAREGLFSLISGERLGEQLAQDVMDEVMEGKVPSAQLAGILIALRLIGEGKEEITGLARAMRNRVHRELHTYVPHGFEQIKDRLVDTCGTGGDGVGTFNISTAAALVVAAAGVPVAKHGNRAVSGRAGSADVLEALGVAVNQPPAVSFASLMETGFGFFFAPQCHRAMAHAAPTRRDLGVPTVFNLLGPLTNPAGAGRQLLGVNSPQRVEVMAQVLERLGATSAWVVHGHDGLDEISLTGPSKVARLKNGQIDVFTLEPKDFGFEYCRLQDLAGGDKHDNAALIERVFNGQQGPQRHVIVLNAAAALCVADRAKDMGEGILLAQEAIDSGQALKLLTSVREFTIFAESMTVQQGVGS